MRMTEEKIDMLNDARPIREVRSADGADPIAAVGRHGVTKIVAYGEPGEYCSIPFIAVYVGDQIVSRWPALKCSVHYTVE